MPENVHPHSPNSVLSGLKFTNLALLLIAAQSPDQPPQLSSDQAIVYDSATQSTIARGNATLTHQGLTVVADEIRYIAAQNIAHAEGNTRVHYGNIRLVGRGLVYDVDTKRTSSEAFRMGSPPLYAEGDGFSGTRDKITVENVTMYFGEPSPVGLNFKAARATVFTEDRIEAENVTFRIGEFPIFRLPRYKQSVDTLAVLLSGKLGYRGNLGAYFRTNSLFPVSENWRAGAVFDVYTKRGLLIGPALGWSLDQPDNRAKFQFESGYINDDGDLGFDRLGDAVDQDRYFFTIRHQQEIGERFSVNAAINAWSDSEVIRDFRPDLFRDDQNPDNFLEAVYRGENFFLTGFLRFAPNGFQNTQERLPEIRLDWMPTPIFDTGTYQSLSASYVRLQEDSFLTKPELESDRFDVFYSLYKPIEVRKWLHLLPVASARLTHYADTLGSDDSFTRVMGEFGLDAEVQAHATWEYKNERWGIDGLRHLVKPVLRWRYLPGGNSGRSEIIPIDREVFSTSLPPIGLANIRNIDDLTDRHVLRLGVENLLQTRNEDYGSRNLVTLNFYQDILFSAEPGEDEWASFYTQMEIHPVNWFSFGLYSKIRTEDLTLEETRTRFRITDGDVWQFSLETDTLQNQINQYDLDFFYKMNERWAFRSRWRVDSRRNDFTEQIYAIRQRIANTWDVEYQLVFHQGSTREDDFGFNIRINLLSF